MKEKTDRGWPDLINTSLGLSLEQRDICKTIRLHAEVLEECTDKICRALWAGVKKAEPPDQEGTIKEVHSKL
jgi:hypothetical protein